MLPKTLRMSGKGCFVAVFNAKKSIFGPKISLFFKENRLNVSRVGVTFRQKAIPLSVTRHFLKRQVNVIMKELLPKLPKGYDFVLLFHRASIKKPTQEVLYQEIQDLFRHWNPLKNPKNH